MLTVATFESRPFSVTLYVNESEAGVASSRLVGQRSAVERAERTVAGIGDDGVGQWSAVARRAGQGNGVAVSWSVVTLTGRRLAGRSASGARPAGRGR